MKFKLRFKRKQKNFYAYGINPKLYRIGTVLYDHDIFSGRFNQVKIQPIDWKFEPIHFFKLNMNYDNVGAKDTTPKKEE